MTFFNDMLSELGFIVHILIIPVVLSKSYMERPYRLSNILFWHVGHINWYTLVYLSNLFAFRVFGYPGVCLSYC